MYNCVILFIPPHQAYFTLAQNQIHNFFSKNVWASYISVIFATMSSPK
jgi:hypothetical protein